MAIDGRTIKQQQERDAAAAAYESKGLQVVAHAIVWVPVAIVVVLIYFGGGGGLVGGLASVVSTGVFLGLMYLKGQSRRNR